MIHRKAGRREGSRAPPGRVCGRFIAISRPVGNPTGANETLVSPMDKKQALAAAFLCNAAQFAYFLGKFNVTFQARFG
jgi:hypothetical protein